MSAFQEIEAEGSAATFEQETYELFESRFEGWSPAEGDVLVWLAKAWSRIGATIVDQARTMSRAAFKRFGETVVTIPPIQASPSAASSVWTMVDEAGHTVPAGTQVVIEAAGDRVVGFVTVGETVIPPEFDKGTILLRAVEPGEAGNGLSADPILSDSLSFVSKIELEGTTADGIDEEDEDRYLGRLVEALQTRSLSLIKGSDFEIDARGVPAIARAKCIEAWNADEDKEEALAVSVYPIDEDGESSSTPTKEELAARQTDKLLSGINYYVGTPDYTTIKGKVEIEVEPGFDKAAVVAAVEAWWPEKFSPARWGLPTQGDPGASGWENHTNVYRLKTIGEIERIGGVARVVTFKHAKDADVLGTTEELTLAGVVPLTKAGTFEVSAV